MPVSKTDAASFRFWAKGWADSGPILGKAISLCAHRGSSASSQQPGGCPWGAPLLSGSITLPSTGPCKTSVIIILLVYSQQVLDADSLVEHHIMMGCSKARKLATEKQKDTHNRRYREFWARSYS